MNNIKHNIKNIKTNNKHIAIGDVFFCSLSAEKYLIYQNLIDSSLIYVVKGFFQRDKWQDFLNNNTTKIIDKIVEIEEKDFDRILLQKLQERYRIPKNLIAITGTKGKTSTCWFTFQMFNLCQQNCGYIGTIGAYMYKNNQLEKINKLDTLTTPSIDELYSFLDTMYNNDIQNVVFEASSHSLEQGRIAGLHINIAGFTNLTQDHLDYHKTMDNYFNAKVKLFTNYQQENDIAIINSEDKRSSELIEICKNKKLKTITFGKDNNDDYYIANIEQHKTNQNVSFKYKSYKYNFTTDILGSFQVKNLILALIIANNSNCNIDLICKNISSIKAPLGRMQKISNQDIFIDYAHTPKSLEESLNLLKSIYKNIIIVFGCGGDRDKKKRPIMFNISQKLANTIILTNDNPRTEKPEDIINDIVCFLDENNNTINPLRKDVFVIEEISKIEEKYKNINIENNIIIEKDRKQAIKIGIEEYFKNKKNKIDTALLIAGKGHEEYQIIGTEKIHLSDYEEVKKIIN